VPCITVPAINEVWCRHPVDTRRPSPSTTTPWHSQTHGRAANRQARLPPHRGQWIHDQLGNEETRARAAQTLRGLVERIELVPNADELAIVLRGDLAAILKFASGKKDPAFLAEADVLEGLLRISANDGVQERKKPCGGGSLGSRERLVAGAGFEPAAFRL
jgi:hypothetical protein